MRRCLIKEFIRFCTKQIEQNTVLNAQARKRIEEATRIEDDRLKAEADAEAVKRSAWIAANGSDRLQRLTAENIEHDAVYRDERLAKDRPSWKWYSEVPGQYGDPRNCPAEAFNVLDEARKSDPAAKLVWIKDTRPPIYAALADFLGEEIVFGWPDELPTDEDNDDDE